MISFSTLHTIVGGTLVQNGQPTEIVSLCIDSRKAGVASGTLFFAITGERHDGHTHVKTLFDTGVRQFIVERSIDVSAIPGSNVIQVDSSIAALQALVMYHRQQFAIPVIGITGSNGKTIIKEWLYQMMSHDRVIVKNPGSYNSQVGVPLAVWQMQPHHQLGIFEAGISRPGEMNKLQQMIRPTIGLFTNLGTAHDEGFSSPEEKVEEKLRLFKDSDVVIYCEDHGRLATVIQQSDIRTFTWGSSSNDLRIDDNGSVVKMSFREQTVTLSIRFDDKASRENIMHCAAVMCYLGYKLDDIRARVEMLRVVPMRMEVKEGINDCQIIDDTYNNDLGGLEFALQFLEHQNQKNTKRIILSDILETGLPDDELASRIVTVLSKYHLDSFVGIGRMMKHYRTRFPWPSVCFETTEDFLGNFDFDSLHDEVILIKGARRFSFEQIVSRLQRKVHGTVMEIDLDALIFNFNYFKSGLKPSTRVMVMVKAFAYGSGSAEIGNLLQYHQADYLGVAYADEGIELRKNNITLPIMVMNPSEESFDAILAYSLEPEIYSHRILKSLVSFLKGRSCTVHIKIDTGMHRLGFEPEEVDGLISALREHRTIKVASIFSHLAGADEKAHDPFTAHQYELLILTADKISETIGYKPLYHILNTPGILRLPQYQLDMVRLGIGLYGVDPTSDGFTALRPVATLKTIISQIKSVAKGETIGYGRRGVAERDVRMATIAIGYADGFSRGFSRGVGEVLINGKRAPVIGNVCMDMTMIDITDIEAAEGDNVIIFGKELPIHDLATRVNTMPYELLTSTSERVKRVFTSDGI